MSKKQNKLINKNKIKNSKGDQALQVLSVSVVTLFSIFSLLPFLIVIGSSLEKEINITKYGFTLIPKTFTLEAYEMILFKDPSIIRAYGVTIFTTVVGTLLAMLLTITLAYPLAQKKLKFRNFFTFFVYFTMLFNGGLVPSYLMISKYLNMKNSIWVLIVPVMFSAWNMFLMRNFFQAIPDELSESAKIDGANDFQTLFKIILPVSIPGIATISLFYALSFWNQWYNSMLYISDRNLRTLQYLIMDVMRSTEALKEMAAVTGIAITNLPSNSLKMAITIVTIEPIVLLYPFVQKYFTSGLTVGAIKG